MQLRYVDREGRRRSGGVFQSHSAARTHYRAVVEQELDGRAVRRDVTLSELVNTFLARHVAEARTIKTLRHRLARPVENSGTSR